MLIALGFLLAVLIGFMIIPAISRRADRLARRRAELAFPLSLAEVEAERDHLRAGFAIRQQELEKKAADGFAARAAAMEEIGRRDMAIGALERDLAARQEKISHLEMILRDTGENLTATAATLAQRDDALAQALVENAGLVTSLAEKSRELQTLDEEKDQLRLTLAEARTHATVLESQLNAKAVSLSGLQETLERTQAELDRSGRDLRQHQVEIERLGSQMGDQDRRMAAADEALGRARAELTARVDELVEARREISASHQRTGEIERALKAAETRLAALDGVSRQDIDTLSAALKKAEAQVARLKAEKTGLQDDLSQMRAERAQLRQEATALRREGERRDAVIRGENAALRAEIAKVADQLLDKGPKPRARLDGKLTTG